MRAWRAPTLAVCALLSGCAGCRPSSEPDAGPPLPPGWLAGQPDPDTGRPNPGGTLVVRLMSEPAGLNFLDDAHRDASTARMTRNLVFESLMEIDPSTFDLKPQLAEKMTVSEDGRRLTFRLRPDATFSDGSRFTADDVIATVNAMMNPQNRTASLRADFEGLQDWTKIGDDTVEFTWSVPSAFAGRNLAKLPIYAAASLQGDFQALPMARAPVGTGPYRVAGWKAGEVLVLERRKGSAAGAWLDRIEFRFVKDHTLATTLFEQGTFDLMTMLQPTVWRSLEARVPRNTWAQQQYLRLKGFENNFSYIGWNEALPFFKDSRVRVAFAYVYPARKVLDSVDLGLEIPTTCPYYPVSWSCDRSVQPHRYDPAEAQALLADAGFEDLDGDGVLERDGEPLRFTFLLPSTSVRLGKIAPLLQEELRKIGAQMDIERVEPAVLGQRIRQRDFGAISRLFVEFDVEHDLYFLLHSSQADGGANVTGFQDPYADIALEAIRHETRVRRRHDIERGFHKAFFEAQPYLLMTTRQSLDMAKRRVHGLRSSPLWYDLRAVWVDAEAGRPGTDASTH